MHSHLCWESTRVLKPGFRDCYADAESAGAGGSAGGSAVGCDGGGGGGGTDDDNDMMRMRPRFVKRYSRSSNLGTEPTYCTALHLSPVPVQRILCASMS